MRRASAIRTAAWVVVAVGVATPLARRRMRLRAPVVAALSYAAPAALAVALPRSRPRDVAVCTLQMWAYLAMYAMPNDDPGHLERRVRVRYPIVADRAIGLGELPGVRLQRALARAGGISRVDAVLVWSHWLWFLVPHGTVAYVLLRRRERFEDAALHIYGVFDVGMLLYWAVPTAPPWYAAGTGEIRAEPELRRLMVEQGERFWKDRWEPMYGFLAGNPLAAMPSLHFATSVMAALVLTEVGTVEGALGWAYTATLGFALVYLGEHYVVDLLAGLGLTLAVRRAAGPVAPLLRAAGRSIAALEAKAHA